MQANFPLIGIPAVRITEGSFTRATLFERTNFTDRILLRKSIEDWAVQHGVYTQKQVQRREEKLINKLLIDKAPIFYHGASARKNRGGIQVSPECL